MQLGKIGRKDGWKNKIAVWRTSDRRNESDEGSRCMEGHDRQRLKAGAPECLVCNSSQNKIIAKEILSSIFLQIILQYWVSN